MKTTSRHIEALTDMGPINGNSVLIDAAELRVIVAELETALEPCAEPVARAEAKRLAACYPTFRPTPDWLDLVEEALRDAPCDLIRKVCKGLSDTHDFPPNRAQVRSAVLVLIARRQRILSRAIERTAEENRAEQRAAFREKLDGRSPLEFFAGDISDD